MRLDKSSFAPGEEIRVHFFSPSSFADNAWIGIIPSHVQHGSESRNDQYDLTYQYLKKRSSGTLIFKAPSKQGAYDFRMHDTDNNGREVASVSFTVGDSGIAPNTNPTTLGNSTLRLDKSTFAPGEEVRVHFVAYSNFADNAWVGIIPSHVQHGTESRNDQYDLTYQYLKKRTSGVLIFKAPSKQGAYDFRMHDTDNNGREVASVSFSVGGVTSASSQQSPDWSQPPQSQAQSSQIVFNNWNKAGCSLTDRANFNLTNAVTIRKLNSWYNWQANQTSVQYRLYQNQEIIYQNVLRKGSCDSYQQTWCQAADTMNLQLQPGSYTVMVRIGRICQNPQSSNNGFIEVHGSSVW